MSTSFAQATVTCKYCMERFHQIDSDQTRAFAVVCRALLNHVKAEHPEAVA